MTEVSLQSKPGLARISVVTGLYNSERYLTHYFHMLDSQTYTNWEAILVDDGSTDATVALVEEKMLQDARYRLVKKKPEGFPSRSRAAGLKVAQGEYVAFCDHDDFWAPQKLEMQIYLLQRLHDLAILHTDRVVWKSLEAPEKLFYFDGKIAEAPFSKQDPNKVIYRGLQIIFSSFITSKNLLEKVGFHPDMKGVDDFYLFVRLAQMGSIYRIDLPLTYYYAHQGNLSHFNNIFVVGFYKVSEVLENDPVPERVKKSILAQACRTEAVSLFTTNRIKALQLLIKSLRLYFIPSTLNRLAFLLVTFFIPQVIQEKIFRLVKRIKFMLPTFKDVLSSTVKSSKIL